MLTARPASLGSWSFVIEDEDHQPLAEIELRRLKDAGTVRVGGIPFDLAAHGWTSKTCTLSFEGVEVASAVRLGAFGKHHDVTVAAGLLGIGAPLSLGLASSWSMRTFRVTAGERDVGTIRRRGFLGRRLDLDLSEVLPLGVQVFLLGVVVIEWRRSTRNG